MCFTVMVQCQWCQALLLGLGLKTAIPLPHSSLGNTPEHCAPSECQLAVPGMQQLGPPAQATAVFVLARPPCSLVWAFSMQTWCIRELT